MTQSNDQLNHRNLELLAPAGSYEGVMAAFCAGADAVYTGGRMFSARAYADNLSEEQLILAIRQAHLLDKKLYLTVNTLLKDRELYDSLGEYLKPLVDAGLDAVIVQDMGVLMYLREMFPELELHASTQMTVAGPDGAALIAPYITRLVPPRELSLHEVRRIYDRTHLEIECFIHGALCYCYSGRCLMSSVYGGRSGNRGRCAQPCRLDYSLEDASGRILNKKNENFLISPKDLCGIDLIPEMADAGVYSFKIEGRMKKPEYTAGVVSVYRKYLDLFYEWDALGRKDALSEFKASKEDRERLTLLFSRNGFTEGYSKRQNGRDMLMLTPKADRGDNQELLNEMKKTYVDPGAPKRIVSMDPVIVKVGEPVTLRLVTERISGDRKMTVEASVASQMTVGEAQKRPMTAEDFADKLGRFGNSPFALSAPVEVKVLSENVFFPVGELNSLRQKAVSLLEEKLIELSTNKSESDDSAKMVIYDTDSEISEESRTVDVQPLVSVLVRNEEQLKAVLEAGRSFGIMRIIFSADRNGFYPGFGETAEKLRSLVNECRRDGHQVLLELPEIFRERAEKYFDSHSELLEEGLFDGFLLHSADELSFVSRKGCSEKFLLGDSSMYVMNREAMKAWKKFGLSAWTVSEELNGKEIRALIRSAGDTAGCFELPVYGRRPVMITAQCQEKTVRGCALEEKREPGDTYLVDRHKEHLPVRRNCLFCYNTIYNAKIYSLAGEDLSELAKQVCTMRLSFFDEDTRKVREVLDRLLPWIKNGCMKDTGSAMDPEDYTKGHFRRDVE